MADELGRTALTLGGAALFGPWGALAGGLLGQFLFPVEGPKGPRLSELNVQRSTVGAPVAIVYGTGVLAGNVIWSGGLQETKHESGGKGGPSGPTTYTYAIDVAIGICEGPISGVRRIWFDADLVYDASDDTTLEARLTLGGVLPSDIADAINSIRAMSAQLNFDLYLGTDDQVADPTIESYEGVGQVPGYRGLAYIVFPQLQLEKYGNRIPNVRLEIVTSGTPTECGLFSAGSMYPWLDGATADPRNPLNSHEYAGDAAGGFNDWQSDPEVARATRAAQEGRPLLSVTDTPGEDSLLWSWSKDSSPSLFPPCNPEDSDEQVQLNLWYNSLDIPGQSCASWSCAEIVAAVGICTAFHRLNDFVGASQPDEGCTEQDLFQGYDEPGTGDCGGGIFRHELSDLRIKVRRTILPPSPCLYGAPLAGAPGYCVVNGQVVQGITWTEVAGTFHVLQEYETTGAFGVVTKYPVDPCLRNDDPDYNNQAFWEAAYAADQAQAVPELPPGLVYGVDYPETTSSAFFSECDTLDIACVPMAIIVADICRRTGLRTDTGTQIDVSNLTSCVPGYIIGRQMSGRDALGPLRMFGLWDAVESNGLLKFVERGHALVASLTDDDLGAHEKDSEPPTKVETTRVQEKDLPRRVRLHFPNFLHDHEVSEQSASRITTEAVDELDVELPVSMDPDTGKQLSEIMLSEAWFSRNTHRFSLDNNWLALEPTDCIEIPVDGQMQRVRIRTVDYKIGGILQIDAVRDDDGAYVSTAVAVEGGPSGGVPGSSGGGPICPSAAVLLDIPCLEGTPPSGEAWIYAAIYGLCDTFDCAALYRSTDGGATYAQVARTDGETTVGEILAITGPATDPTLPGDSPPYDDVNSITVSLYEGELASITDDQIAAGQNLAAIGVDGRWVLLQFKTVTLDTTNQYTLTDLIWGVNDTAHLLGTTVAGDTFVLLSDPHLLRISQPAAAIGVPLLWKVVTCGESLDAVEDFSFTTWGLCYARLCPATVLSATLTAPPSGSLDGDSYLLPDDTSLEGAWANHGGEIATWRDALDAWDFCLPAPGTVIHIVGDSSDAGPGEDVISGGDGTYTPSPWANSSESFVTVEDERTRLPNSLRLVGVDGITVTPSTDGTLEVGADSTLGGGSVSPLTTKGDLYTFDTDDQRIGVGADGEGLVADASEATGLRWGAFGIPPVTFTGDITVNFDHNGRSFDHLSGGGAGDEVTIDSHANDPLPLGFTFTVFNMDTNAVTVAITSDTLRKAQTGSTGSVTIPQYCVATFRKVASTEWLWFGVGAV